MAVEMKTYDTNLKYVLTNVETKKSRFFNNELEITDWIIATYNKDDSVANGPFIISKVESCGEMLEDEKTTEADDKLEKLEVLEELLNVIQKEISELKDKR
ncbi:hypothetical protein [Campylobacter fetus]|uniref:hypothetical protein n=1 Tax=Campylobacter fetus TaxID=196 RepID=UPI000FC9DECC|nr:hypothetical protein [Campylobacter fetus]RUT50969.1 hypothetical protein BWK67_00150 [Campylobacter fetus]RUT51697.1 hypothetical protein BWK51_00150 [Campylobacter fetus]